MEQVTNVATCQIQVAVKEEAKKVPPVEEPVEPTPVEEDSPEKEETPQDVESAPPDPKDGKASPMLPDPAKLVDATNQVFQQSKTGTLKSQESAKKEGVSIQAKLSQEEEELKKQKAFAKKDSHGGIAI